MELNEIRRVFVENILWYAETELGAEIRLCPECCEIVRYVGGALGRHAYDCLIGEIDDLLFEEEDEQ